MQIALYPSRNTLTLSGSMKRSAGRGLDHLPVFLTEEVSEKEMTSNPQKYLTIQEDVRAV